uniref:Uncharacterized protein LOC104247958 n=1 Tax=Nicotiana sylvestris TaxID=4096 RepID=A0A1U7YH09_NICSY|nr:PREDICTED: uncharacterized protein LOC104247958 [Nicotiana sylvestris]
MVSQQFLSMQLKDSDDLLLFSRGDIESVATIRRRFMEFSEASGLQANKDKRSIYFGGVTKEWQPLINNMISRITAWTAKKLSYAGRAQLIQTVLFGIQAYWSQIFAIPSKVLNAIEAIYCRSYLWSSTNTITRKALLAWEKVCTPKLMGWMVRRIFEAGRSVTLVQHNNKNNLIKKIYLQLIGNNERIPWKTLRFGNDARPKAQFTMWLRCK